MSATALQERCVKESLSQSQDCSNLVFSQSRVLSASYYIFILVL